MFIDLAKLNHHSHLDDILRRFLFYLHPASTVLLLNSFANPLNGVE